jgi:uroporphyrinogen-III decarboxylase
MKERIDIVVPDDVLALNPEKEARLAKTHRFEETDRAPVIVSAQLWSLLAGRGATFSEMTKSPRDHLRGLILNHKYRCEHIRDDQPIPTEKLVLEQDFGAIRGVEFPMEVVFRGDDQPKTLHLLHSLEDIDSLTIPDPYSNHNKMRIDWYREMKAHLGDFDVRLNGEPLEVEVDINHPGGPIPSAFALCGSNFFLWMMMDPDRIHRLLEIVTESHLNCIAYMDEVKGVSSDHPIWVGADTGELMGPAQFKEFGVPYYKKLWKKYPGERIYHMCGKMNHLLDIVRDELEINYLSGFGFPTDMNKLADSMAGRVRLWGGLHPVHVHDGPVDEIISECGDYIRTVGKHGGYILGEGFGLMAGTPPEHVDAMVESSRRIGWIGKPLQD